MVHPMGLREGEHRGEKYGAFDCHPTIHGHCVLSRLCGAALALATLARGTFLYLQGGPSFDVASDLGLLPLIVPAQALLAVWVVWNVLKHGPRPLLRILSLAFAGSFVVAYGWYLLLTPRGFLVGVGNLLYLIAALLALGAWLSSFGARLGNQPTPSEEERRAGTRWRSTSRATGRCRSWPIAPSCGR